MGDRNGRFAIVLDKEGKVVYAEKEKDPRQVTVSPFCVTMMVVG